MRQTSTLAFAISFIMRVVIENAHNLFNITNIAISTSLSSQAYPLHTSFDTYFWIYIVTIVVIFLLFIGVMLK